MFCPDAEIDGRHADGPFTAALNQRAPFVDVRGADLRRWIAQPTEGQQQLRKLLTTHGLVVFRDVQLSPREHVALVKLANYHAEFDHTRVGVPGGWNAKTGGIATLPADPEVLCQGNVLLQDHHGIDSLQLKQLLTYEDEGFHSDGMHNMQERLPVLTSMHCLRAPVAGGETFFACARLAFSRLDPALQVLCRRLEVHYEYDEGGGLAIMRKGIVREGRHPQVRTNKGAPGKPPICTVHPLVRTHPETGEETLYMSCANIKRMKAEADDEHRLPALDLDTAASYDLIGTLLHSVTQPPFVHAHMWQVGDLAIWDNRCALSSCTCP